MEYEAVCTRPEHVAASGLSARQLDLFLDGLASIVQPAEVNFKESAMSDLSTCPLRLSRSIRAGVERLSKQDGVSINQFVSIAVENYRAQVMSADGLQTPPQPGQWVGSILGAEITRHGGVI